MYQQTIAGNHIIPSQMNISIPFISFTSDVLHSFQSNDTYSSYSCLITHHFHVKCYCAILEDSILYLLHQK